jgi:hypothetical protein
MKRIGWNNALRMTMNFLIKALNKKIISWKKKIKK